MRSPLPIPPKILAALALAFVLAGCQPGNNPRPVPSVPQIGGDLKCSQGDNGLSDQQAGWGFCYPDTWRYTERSQADTSPSGLDLTFDITCLKSCKASTCPSPAANGQCPPEPGLFGFMVISTYDRGSSSSVSSWIDSNLPGATAGDSISWGNSVEAVKLSDGRRLALTQHHVVVMDLHKGLLDLEGEMSTRLSTWKFSY
jgi:hypothetical protein